MSANLTWIQHAFGDTSDLKLRHVVVHAGGRSPGGAWRLAFVFLEGMVDKAALQEEGIAAVERGLRVREGGPGQAGGLALLERAVIAVTEVERVTTLGKLVGGLLDGKTAVLLDGEPAALLADTIGRQKRAIAEPQIESVVRGPRQGFVEALKVNVALVRQILRTPRLRFQSMTVGDLSQTPVWLGYLDGRVDPRTLAEVERRIRQIKIDAVLESRYIEEFIVDNRLTPFPLIDVTERPEKVVGALLEGRVAIFTDGTPFVLLAPTVLSHLVQATEDYYTAFQFATFARIMRSLAMVAIITFPSLYVALVSYHHEMIPTTLALRLIAAQRDVPFTAIVEAFILELIFEAIREAGLRLPTPAGQAVTIVGALILGEAAIQASLVTPMMVIIVAATGIASFTMPNYQLAIALRIIRFPIMVLAGTFGIPGVLTGLTILLFHLCSLRSFGVPYLTPLAPLRRAALGDALVRLPHWASRRSRSYQPGQGPGRVEIRETSRARRGP